MSTPKTLRIAFCLVAMVCFLPSTGAAQAPENKHQMYKALQEFSGALTLPSPYQRHTFVYPRLGRPDPVMPPPIITRRNESLPTLLVSAIILDRDDASQSIAILRVGDSKGEQKRVAVGDRIGQIEIAQILATGVKIRIHTLDAVKTETLPLATSDSSKP